MARPDGDQSEEGGHTFWGRGGVRGHDPEWCGRCLLAAKLGQRHDFAVTVERPA